MLLHGIMLSHIKASAPGMDDHIGDWKSRVRSESESRLVLLVSFHYHGTVTLLHDLLIVIVDISQQTSRILFCRNTSDVQQCRS